MLLALTLMAGACNESQRPPTTPSTTPTIPSPSPSEAPPQNGAFTLSGVVYEITREGRRPLAGVPLDVSVEYQQRPPKVTSDSEGRYSLSNQAGQLKVKAEKEGFSQPCRANVDLTQDGILDIFVVSDSLLATSGVPPSFPIFEPTISGRVFERTSNGLNPVAAARVYIDFTAGFGSAPSANTITDAAGRFLMCNVGDVGFGLAIGVSKPPAFLSDFISLPTPFPKDVDIEIRKQ
jgi:hypothetical protein